MNHGNLRKLALALVLLLVVTTPSVSSPVHHAYRVWLPVVRSKKVANFYVDNSGADGVGTIGNPWNNIAGHVDDLAAGDTMHVRGNASPPARIYTEAKINPTVNGSSGSRITLQPYQSELVIIQNNSGDHTFELKGDYWTIEDFEEIDNDGAFVYCIEIKASHIIIRDIGAIHNGRHSNIVIYAGYTDTEIRNNVIYDFDRSPESQDASGVNIYINADRTIIDGNTIHDCSGDAVHFYDGGWASAADSPADCEITNNHFYRGPIDRAEDGIDVKCSQDLLISDNTIHGYGRSGVSNPTARGINLTNQGHDGCIIEDNVIYNVKHGFRCGTGPVTNTVLRNNLIYDCSDRGLRIERAESLNIYNNTIVDTAGFGLRVALSGWTGGNLKNNLWYNCGHLTKDAGAPFGATADYNGRWDTTSDAAFVGANDTTGIGDPGFVNAAGDDYRLLGTSNAVDAGVNVGLPFYGVAPDLGYWEYGGATTTTSTTSTVSITTTTTTLYDPYADALIVNCATAMRTVEPLTVAQIIERNAIAAAAQGL